MAGIEGCELQSRRHNDESEGWPARQSQRAHHQASRPSSAPTPLRPRQKSGEAVAPGTAGPGVTTPEAARSTAPTHHSDHSGSDCPIAPASSAYP
ncbi:hypothetical protein GQ53DRAFT_745005 [Thozetella sp. PMI_491]|nr:hypothetical protein GQ53DRAFT_745005 [Thozetella sp. PMI_491]